MSELDGKPYVFAWDSNTRDYRGSRIVKFRVCYTLRRSNRWSKPFTNEQQALQHAEEVDGFGNLLRNMHSVTTQGQMLRDEARMLGIL